MSWIFEEIEKSYYLTLNDSKSAKIKIQPTLKSILLMRMYVISMAVSICFDFSRQQQEIKKNDDKLEMLTSVQTQNFYIHTIITFCDPFDN